MKAERARLARLKRLEKLRAIARQDALAEAGRAEARLAQLTQLGERTASLVGAYGARTDAASGADLASQRLYLGELVKMASRNQADIAAARDHARLARLALTPVAPSEAGDALRRMADVVAGVEL